MATSSKVQFKLSTLREKAIESINFRIASAELRVASYDDDEALALRVQQWRADQEAKIARVFSRLGPTPEEGDREGISDFELAKFKLDPMPEVDRYDRRDAERKLEELRGRKTKIEAKSEALVADAEGNISLTTTQLSEFFGL